MSEQRVNSRAARLWYIPMRARSPDGEHRAATPLELFFDLVFVVAVAQAASSLHHGIAELHVAEAVLSYAMVFFAIWWAWMNFTWFASAYDTDDVLYRLAVFVQLAGALILAAGVGLAFNERNFTIATAGYVVMRVALVGQWLRAGWTDKARRPSAYRYASGVSLVQAGWVALLFVPAAWRLAGFGLLVLAELLVPVWAERAAATTWHSGHIAERYGLFTIIVLGESILAASVSIQALIQAGELNNQTVTIAIGGLLIVLCMWWLYFDEPMYDLLTSLRRAFFWGYGHLLIFASAAAVGAGLAVAIDTATGHSAIGTFGASAAVTVPVALYLICLWTLHPRTEKWTRVVLFLGAALCILLSTFTAEAVLLTGLLLVTMLTILQIARHRRQQRAAMRSASQIAD